MQAPRNTTPAHTACRIVASLALLSTLLACGYKGPLYMPPPPAPDAELTTPPEPVNLPTETSSQSGQSATTNTVQTQ